MSDSIDVEFVVQRFRPEDDSRPWSERFIVPARPGMTVLDGLFHIRDHLDATLSWRYSCRMSVCGSCAMIINGRPGLACSTQIRVVPHARVELRPLDHFPVIKDLAVDNTSMFRKHRSLSPWIAGPTPASGPDRTDESIQSQEQLLEFLQVADCIKCGACMAACPSVASDPDFVGPMPLTAALRYTADSRDDGFAARRSALAGASQISHCHFAAECSRVCPKGADPALAIQLLRRQLLLDAVGLRRPARAATRPLGAAYQGKASDVPTAPPYTVDREQD